MTLEENKIYYTQYGGKWLLHVSRIRENVIHCHFYIRVEEKDELGEISKDQIFSNAYPACMSDNFSWREATSDEISAIEKATGEPINNFQSLYEIY